MNKRIDKFLKKVAWKTRRWNFEISPLHITYQYSSFEFDLFFVRIGTNFYRLFAIHFRLPNHGYTNVFTVDLWDFLFLRTYLISKQDELEDKSLYSLTPLNFWQRIQLNILNKIL